MQLNKYQKKYKLWLELKRRESEVWNKIKDLPWLETDPFQRGWVLKFELREDIKRRDDAVYIEEAMNLAYRHGYLSNVLHVKMVRRGEKGYVHRNGKWVSFNPPSNYLTEKEYLALVPQVQKFFYEDTSDSYYTRTNRKIYRGSFPAYYFRLKARPNIITQVRKHGGELQSEYDRLTERIWYSGEFIEFQTNYGASYPAHSDRRRTRDKIQKFKNGDIEEFYNERIPREYDY